MEKLTCRLLPLAVADGPHNMAADEALLETALNGIASFRCYTWSEPTLSLGYFQPAAAHDQATLPSVSACALCASSAHARSTTGTHSASSTDEEKEMITILIVLLVLGLLASLPSWPYSTGWGYYPSGGLGLVLVILIILALAGRL